MGKQTKRAEPVDEFSKEIFVVRAVDSGDDKPFLVAFESVEGIPEFEAGSIIARYGLISTGILDVAKLIRGERK